MKKIISTDKTNNKILLIYKIYGKYSSMNMASQSQ